jgi:hypothetical protein
MAAGSPVSMSNAAATTTKRGSVLRAGAVSALTVTATTGTLPTANGAITIANAASPTVAELQEFCVELNARLNALRTAMQTAGQLT